MVKKEINQSLNQSKQSIAGLPRIIDAEYITSVFDRAQLRLPRLPEAAFIGRSNVGKSSLINRLTNRKKLAISSQNPGTTKAINFYRLIFESTSCVRHQAYLADLPGYGFAKAPGKLRAKWETICAPYLTTRQELRAIYLLIDCRREVEDEELWLRSKLAGQKLVIVMTKVDKLSKSELKQRREILSESLEIDSESIFQTSVLDNRNNDLARLRNVLLETLT